MYANACDYFSLVDKNEQHADSHTPTPDPAESFPGGHAEGALHCFATFCSTGRLHYLLNCALFCKGDSSVQLDRTNGEWKKNQI